MAAARTKPLKATQPKLVFAPPEALAIARFDADPYRPRLQEGRYDIDVKVRIQGAIAVGPDYEQLFVSAPDYHRLLAAALGRLPGVSLADLVHEAYGMKDEPPPLGAELRELVGQHKEKTACRGHVRGILEFDRLGNKAA